MNLTYYVIIAKMYNSNGGFFGYATNPKFDFVKFEYTSEEFVDFINKWKYIVDNREQYYDDILVFKINYSTETITNITNQFNTYLNLL